jgi:hypothetical protein
LRDHVYILMPGHTDAGVGKHPNSTLPEPHASWQDSGR